MEFRSSTISINNHLPPPVPFLSSKLPICTFKNKKTCSRLTIRKLHLSPAISLYSFFNPLTSNQKFQISAHFRRPTNRQNYLRKKLSKQLEQFQQVSTPENPSLEYDRVDTNESKLDNLNEEIRNVDESSSLDNEPFVDGYKGMNINPGSNPENDGGLESKKKLGESIMWNKLERWVDQYKKDSEFWGVGTGPIFTIYKDSHGRVEKVVVNEAEILKRALVDKEESEELADVNFKISFAKDLAREMESGSSAIPDNSTVAKFLSSGRESNYTSTSQGFRLPPVLLSRNFKIGVLVLCGVLVAWAVKGLFNAGEEKEEYTTMAKEMLRRKMKVRTEKEKMMKGSVEVLQDPIESKSLSLRRPKLDKEELLNGLNHGLEVVKYPGYKNKEFRDKIEEIKIMARQAREIEKRSSSGDQEAENTSNDPIVRESDEILESESLTAQRDNIQQSFFEADAIAPNGTKSEIVEIGNTKLVEKISDLNQIKESESLSAQRDDIQESISGADAISPNGTNSEIFEVGKTKLVEETSDLNEIKELESVSAHGNYIQQSNSEADAIAPNGTESLKVEAGDVKVVEKTSDLNQTKDSESSTVQEDYIQHSNSEADALAPNGSENLIVDVGNVKLVEKTPDLDKENLHSDASGLQSHVDENSSGAEFRIITTAKEAREYLSRKKKRAEVKEHETRIVDQPGVNFTMSTENIASGIIEEAKDASDQVQESSSSAERCDFAENAGMLVSDSCDENNSDENRTSVGDQIAGTSTNNEFNVRVEELSVSEESWIEKNFQEFDPIVNKIRDGFRANYHVARAKSNEVLDLKTDNDDESELEWMKDEKLRGIVFRVRDNELSGRDPFHLMDEQDKRAFFSGLEKKVEQENEKLRDLHEYFHSNIENLDYGADGISIYDPPEKILPRWKVPPAEKNPEFLNTFLQEREAVKAESLKNSFFTKKTVADTLQKSEGNSSSESSSIIANVPNKSIHKKPTKTAKTTISASDGSVKAGKRSGKEFWHHTKKWSEGFLQSYNAETDPEVKSVMKDMGKDLDRWITEKEIQEGAELMEKLPEKGQKFVKEKLEKVKREMELFGPQAVLSKYGEYGDEKEEDNLWWLDLPFVLCIELYTIEDGEQRMGFYSLEMAADLELDPKQHHVVAFEDTSDCKKFCYIMQAHMEMLGNGNAFVVARPPKDAFREARDNGFSVTVIRKGQLKLNIDQTLEEVEELIEEIGSKMYHDKIMKERSVDINGLMKGVFGASKPAKRKRSKRKLKSPIKP